MIILGLDIATRTGWCVGAPTTAPTFGATTHAPTGAPEGAVFSGFRAWLEGAIEVYEVSHVFAEQPYVPRPSIRFGRAGAAVPGSASGPPVDMAVIYRLIGLRAVAKLVAYDRQVSYKEFTPSQIAKHFTGFARFPGKRAEKKKRVIDIAKLYGYDVGSDDDKADAIAVWHLGCATVSPYARPAGPLMAQPGGAC